MKEKIRTAVNSLAHGGYLMTGETERTILMHHGYREIISQSAIFQIVL